MPPYAAESVWKGWSPATCLPDDCFCEAIREGVVRQPANAWSSLGFVIVALWIVLRLRQSGPVRAVLSAAEAWLFVCSLFLLGLGSALYHASLTFAGQVLDVAGMYFVATFILLHRLAPRFHLPPAPSVVLFVLGNAALMTAQVTTPSLRRVVFSALLVTALVVEWRFSAGRKWLAAGAFLMALAVVIWALDRERVVCSPHSVLQGHALWHFLSAIAAACLFRSYEQASPNKT